MVLEELFKLVDCVPTPIFIMDVTPGQLPIYAHYNSEAIEKTGFKLSEIVGRNSIEVFGTVFGPAACEEQRSANNASTSTSYRSKMRSASCAPHLPRNLMHRAASSA